MCNLARDDDVVLIEGYSRIGNDYVLDDNGHFVFTMLMDKNYHTATGIALGEDRYEVTTVQRRDCVQYSPSLATLEGLLDKLSLTTVLFGFHEFSYDGAESTVEHPLSMHVFCVKR